MCACVFLVIVVWVYNYHFTITLTLTDCWKASKIWHFMYFLSNHRTCRCLIVMNGLNILLMRMMNNSSWYLAGLFEEPAIKSLFLTTPRQIEKFWISLTCSTKQLLGALVQSTVKLNIEGSSLDNLDRYGSKV